MLDSKNNENTPHFLDLRSSSEDRKKVKNWKPAEAAVEGREVAAERQLRHRAKALQKMVGLNTLICLLLAYYASLRRRNGVCRQVVCPFVRSFVRQCASFTESAIFVPRINWWTLKRQFLQAYAGWQDTSPADFHPNPQRSWPSF